MIDKNTLRKNMSVLFFDRKDTPNFAIGKIKDLYSSDFSVQWIHGYEHKSNESYYDSFESSGIKVVK